MDKTEEDRREARFVIKSSSLEASIRSLHFLNVRGMKTTTIISLPVGNWTIIMVLATYHKRKLYIPKDVEEALELSDGDQAKIQVLDKESFKVSPKRKPRRVSAAERHLIDRILNRPFSGKLSKRHFRRKDYYENS